MDKKINTGGTAFPEIFTDPLTDMPESTAGLTVRQYYAAQALHGLVAFLSPDQVGKRAFAYADAVIAYEESEKEKSSV